MARGRIAKAKRTVRYTRTGKTKKSVSFTTVGKGKKPRGRKHQEHRAEE